MNMICELCPITSIKMLNSDICDITVKTDFIASKAKYGQFIHIKCGDDSLLRRPISICDVNGDELRFIFAIRGKGTQYLAKLKVGDKVDILGPLGYGTFNININSDKEAVFVGGGIGIYPLLYPSKNIKNRSNVILGFRNKDVVVMEDEFKNACKNLIVTTDDGSYGQKGFVTTPLEKLLKKGNIGTIYACGPLEMLKGVQELAKQYDVDSQLSMEERMGCGIGACLVCACKTKTDNGNSEYTHVCKNGPVYDGRKVIFDE